MGRKRSENGRQGRKTEDWQTGDGKERRESIGGRTGRQRWGNGEAEMGKWVGGEGEMGRRRGGNGQARRGRWAGNFRPAPTRLRLHQERRII